jgi:hypothetical protein
MCHLAVVRPLTEINGHFHWQGRTAPDPNRPVCFLLSSHSAKEGFHEMECYKAAAGSLTVSAWSFRLGDNPETGRWEYLIFNLVNLTLNR